MIDNRTPWSAMLMGVSDDHGEPAICVAIEATCSLDGCAHAEQPEMAMGGIWDGDPATSAPREAPCSPLPKAGTDCLLRGHGYARDVHFQCGPVSAAARLYGPRTWQRRWVGIRPGPEATFEPVALSWENAAGATRDNPVGVGVVAKGVPFRDEVALPRVEHPNHPLTRWGRAVRAVGFGPTTPAWLHRCALDTCDPAAQQVAPPELIAPPLRGDEAVSVSGCRQPIACRLPGIPPPLVRIVRRSGDLLPEARLDTVLIDADALTIRLTWRAWTLVGEHGLVTTVEIR